MPSTRSRHGARAVLAAGLVAALLTPAVGRAQFGGALGRMIGSKVASRAGGNHGFPPGFSDARYEVTAERVDGLVRGIAQYQAALDRYNAAYAKQEAADRARAPQAEREQRAAQQEMNRQLAAAAPAMKCGGEVMAGVQKLPPGDPRRVRADALVARMQALGDESEQRAGTGQPVDSAAVMRRVAAMTDSLALLVVGHRCPPMPKGMFADDGNAPSSPSPSRPQLTPPSVDEYVDRATHLDDMQRAVLCDKFVAYFGAQQRHIEPAGFAPAELDVLRARGAALHSALTRGTGTVCSGIL